MKSKRVTYSLCRLAFACMVSSCGAADKSTENPAARPAEPSFTEPNEIRQLNGFSRTWVWDPVFAVKLYVREVGEPNAPKLLLIHGVGAGGGSDWYPVLKGLAKRYRVIVPDLPGFGHSGRSEIVYEPENYVKALHAFAEEHIKGPFYLMGHSMGAALTLLYAGTYPEDVTRLILADAAGILHRHALADHTAALTVAQAPAPIRGPVGLVTGAVKQGLRVLDIQPEAVVSSDALRASVLRDDPQAVSALSLVEFNFAPAAAAVRAPTALLWGEEDNVAPMRTAAALEAQISGATLHVFKGCGHVPMVEMPGAFIDAVHRHLSGGEESKAIAPSEVSKGNGVCRDQKEAAFEGRFDTISIEGCGRVVLRNVQAATVRIESSHVTIDNTVIAGGETGLFVSHATVWMTGGRIEAGTALVADDSTVDLAGTDLVGRAHAVGDASYAKLIFSICKVKSLTQDIFVHGLVSVSPEIPFEKAVTLPR